jgi:hypothetical protein
MARLWHDALRRPGADLPFLVLCVAVTLAMFRAADEPSVVVHAGGTDISIVPTDIAIAVLGVCCLARLLGSRSLPRPARSISAAAGAFCAWLLLSSALNGFTTLVGAVKLLEYAILGLGAVLFLQRRSTFWSFVALLVALAAVADLYALKGFAQHPGARQDSFTGAHDLAALCSMSLVLTFAALFTREHRLGRLPLVAAIVGSVGVILGAALATLLGVFLAAGAVIALAAARRAVTVRALLATLALVAVVTAGSLSLRSHELGFLNAWFGSNQKSAQPGQYAASWSQRLIFVYIGGKVFAANPVVGTGWYGELPPKEWARFLPAAKRRFPDQPPNYFPKPTQDLTPQQTYDQVLYELGIVGALLFLALGALTVRTATRVGRRWPRGGPDEAAAYLPAGWTASLAGAIAGAALFGGIPMTAIFWLTIGLVALAPSLMPPEPVPAPAG